jgi:hypothetical protein
MMNAERTPESAEALLSAWNEAGAALRVSFPQGVLEFEQWGLEIAERLIESAFAQPGEGGRTNVQ